MTMSAVRQLNAQLSEETFVHDVFIGRQPVFDRDLEVWGYELLFRSGLENAASFPDASSATSRVILNALLEFGLSEVVGGAQALINLPQEFLVQDIAALLPKDRVVLEVLEDAELDQDAIDGVERLSAEGFTIALDDFAFEERWNEIVPYAGILKVEVPALSEREIRSRRDILAEFQARDVRLLAEKVETRAEFELYRELGFDLFQGFFFGRPNILNKAGIPSSRMQTLRLLSELNRDDSEVEDIEALVRSNVDLTYKLMRLVNSSAFALNRQVESVRDAVVYVGVGHVRRLATMVALASVDDKPNELLTVSLVRARMCERFAALESDPDLHQAFTVGMLSTLDAMLDQPMAEILEHLPLSGVARAALLEEEGKFGRYLRWSLGCERAESDVLNEIAVGSEDLGKNYLDSIVWARDTLNSIAA